MFDPFKILFKIMLMTFQSISPFSVSSKHFKIVPSDSVNMTQKRYLNRIKNKYRGTEKTKNLTIVSACDTPVWDVIDRL